MSEEQLQTLLEKVLADFSPVQINLASKAARVRLAKAMKTKLTSKFYLVPFASQETFE